MGARDSSFMNRVSFLAKWLSQSIMAFIIFKLILSFSNKRFMQKLVLNASCSLTFKVHTLTGLWPMITFTIYLSNQLTFLVMSLIHVFSLLITGYLYDLIIIIHLIHAIGQFNSFNKHKIFRSNQTTTITIKIINCSTSFQIY